MCAIPSWKKRGFKLLTNSEELRKTVRVFSYTNSSVDATTKAGEKFMLALYSAPYDITSLDDLRFNQFKRSAAQCPIQRPMQLASLPPTSAAAKQQSLRVCLQVQQWYGNELPAEEWGWKKKIDGQLTAVTTLLAAAPEELLRLISCSCKGGCERACGCRKAGLKCSQICRQCRGIECTNVKEVSEDYTDDEEAQSDDSYDDTMVNSCTKRVRIVPAKGLESDSENESD